MPAQAPLQQEAATERLNTLGRNIRDRRKALRVSATAAAGAAGMSRVTWHRIERGEPSVTMGAYLNALHAIGLELKVDVSALGSASGVAPHAAVPERIVLADYPQLQRLAWHAPGLDALTPAEALSLYERNWRHIDATQMPPHERALIEALVQAHGKGRLLV